jgi:hypothetical protein
LKKGAEWGTYKGEPSWHELLELVVNEDALHVQLYRPGTFREHVAGQLERDLDGREGRKTARVIDDQGMEKGGVLWVRLRKGQRLGI